MAGITEDVAAPPSPNRAESGATQADREWARTRVEKKHKLRAALMAYIMINAFLVGAWAVTGFGYFWPGWLLAGWGVLLLLDAWNLYYHRPVTEEEIDRELRNRH